MLQDEVQREGAMVQDVCSSRAAHATRTNGREQAQAKRCDAICESLPACPATTTIFLMLSHSHSLTTAAAVPAPTKHSCAHAHTLQAADDEHDVAALPRPG
jgi:hypothetical protein